MWLLKIPPGLSQCSGAPASRGGLRGLAMQVCGRGSTPTKATPPILATWDRWVELTIHPPANPTTRDKWAGLPGPVLTSQANRHKWVEQTGHPSSRLPIRGKWVVLTGLPSISQSTMDKWVELTGHLSRILAISVKWVEPTGRPPAMDQWVELTGRRPDLEHQLNLFRGTGSPAVQTPLLPPGAVQTPLQRGAAESWISR